MVYFWIIAGRLRRLGDRGNRARGFDACRYPVVPLRRRPLDPPAGGNGTGRPAEAGAAADPLMRWRTNGAPPARCRTLNRWPALPPGCSRGLEAWDVGQPVR